MRGTALAVAVGCLALGGAVAANVALLGLADRPHDRVGRLQLRLATPPGSQQETTTARPPAIVEATSPPARPVDDETGPDD